MRRCSRGALGHSDVAELWVKVGHGGPGVHQTEVSRPSLSRWQLCQPTSTVWSGSSAFLANRRFDVFCRKSVTNGKFEETTFFFSATLPRVHQGTNEGGRHPPAPGDGVGSDETHMEQHNGAGSHENTVKVRQAHPLEEDADLVEERHSTH